MGAALVAAATRQVHWNVTTAMLVVMYVSMVAALAVLAYGVWRLVRVWRLGRSAVVWDELGARSRRMLAAIAQATVLRKRVPGLMHALVFYGFLVLFIGTAILAFQDDIAQPLLGWTFWEGPFYLGYSLFLLWW